MLRIQSELVDVTPTLSSEAGLDFQIECPSLVDHLAAREPIVFECPKCLGQVSVPRESAGMRVPCPDCEVSLLVPGALASGSGFDDLFDEPEADSPEMVAGTGQVSTTQPDAETEDVVVTAQKAREWQRMFDHAAAFCEVRSSHPRGADTLGRTRVCQGQKRA